MSIHGMVDDDGEEKTTPDKSRCAKPRGNLH